MQLRFSGPLWYWRGPAPFYFVSVPAAQCKDLKAASKFVTYGWGMIPVRAQVGGTRFRTALWPKESGYVVPIKVMVRRAEGIEEGDVVAVLLDVG